MFRNRLGRDVWNVLANQYFDLQIMARLSGASTSDYGDYLAYILSLSPLALLQKMLQLNVPLFSRFINRYRADILQLASRERCQNDDDSAAREILLTLTVDMDRHWEDLNFDRLRQQSADLVAAKNLPGHILHSVNFFCSVMEQRNIRYSSRGGSEVWSHFRAWQFQPHIADVEFFKNVKGINFRDSDLSFASWPDTDFTDCNLSNTYFGNANMQGALIPVTHANLSCVVTNYCLASRHLTMTYFHPVDRLNEVKEKLAIISKHFESQLNYRMEMSYHKTGDHCDLSNMMTQLRPGVADPAHDYFSKRMANVFAKIASDLRVQLLAHVEHLQCSGHKQDAVQILQLARHHPIFGFSDNVVCEGINKMLHLFGSNIKLKTTAQREIRENLKMMNA